MIKRLLLLGALVLAVGAAANLGGVVRPAYAADCTGTTVSSLRLCFNRRMDNQYHAIQQLQNDVGFVFTCFDPYDAVIAGTTPDTGFTFTNADTTTSLLEGFTTPLSSGLQANIELLYYTGRYGCGGLTPPDSQLRAPTHSLLWDYRHSRLRQ